jgi:exosortase A
LGTILLFAVFWPTVAHTVGTWYNSATFNHGFLIFPICGYLLWIKRGSLAGMAPRPSWWGIPAVLAAGGGWLIGHAANAVVVEQFALIGMIWGLMLTLLGIAIVRHMVFPMFYMLFAVPVGDFLIPPLQDVTAHFSVFFLRLIGIPTFLDGIFISIPTGNFEVAEACAGERFLIATVALGFLFAHLTYTRPARRIAFVALSFAVPVIANGFRAFGIVLIAYLSNNELAVGVDHIVYGWIFFAFVTLLLLGIGMTFRDSMPDNATPDPRALHDAGRIAVAPRQIVVAALAALVAALAAPAYAAVIDGRPTPELRVPLVAPEIGNGWTAVARANSDWTPSFPGAASRLSRSFVKNRHEVELYIALYTRQRQGAEMISDETRIADGTNWTRAATGAVSVRVDGGDLPVAVTRMLNRGRGRIALDWYWIGGRYTSNPYIAKALQAFDRLFVGARPAAAIVISATYDDRPAEAMTALKDFVADMGPLRPLLEKATTR